MTSNKRTPRPPSGLTKRNWWIDALLLVCTLVVLFSSVYFLYAPGGYQGGRNPNYNSGWVLSRDTWDWLHMWFGIGMILVATIHFILHWKWFVMMGKRIVLKLRDDKVKMTGMAWLNLFVDLAIAIGFVLAAISGVYFLFSPGGRHAVEPGVLFTRSTWDAIHTWSGIVMILAFVGHTIIHWRWIVNVSGRMIGSFLPRVGRVRPVQKGSSLQSGI